MGPWAATLANRCFTASLRQTHSGRIAVLSCLVSFDADPVPVKKIPPKVLTFVSFRACERLLHCGESLVAGRGFCNSEAAATAAVADLRLSAMPRPAFRQIESGDSGRNSLLRGLRPGATMPPSSRSSTRREARDEVITRVSNRSHQRE